jgi:hypothetical protein
VSERHLLPPEAHAFCEVRYQGREYAQPRTVAPTNKKRTVLAFEYLWLEQNHSELVEYHQPSLPLPPRWDDAKSLCNQDENIEHIRDKWDRAREALEAREPRSGLSSRGVLGIFALTGGFLVQIGDGAFVFGAMAGAITYAFLWSVHAAFRTVLRHRRITARVKRELEQEKEEALEKALDEMHRTVNAGLQPYRR